MLLNLYFASSKYDFSQNILPNTTQFLKLIIIVILEILNAMQKSNTIHFLEFILFLLLQCNFSNLYYAYYTIQLNLYFASVYGFFFSFHFLYFFKSLQGLKNKTLNPFRKKNHFNITHSILNKQTLSKHNVINIFLGYIE